MLTFKPFQTSPTWQFPDPDNTKHMHIGSTRAELVNNIVQYRAQNRLETIENLSIVLDTYLCGRPENAGKCKEAELKRGLIQYLKGGLALVKNVFYGEENMVSQEEADRRGAICKNCPCNSFPDRGMFVQWSDDLALHSIGDRKSTYHDDLGNCEACSCCMRAKVFYKGPFGLLASERDKMKKCNPKCWQLLED